MNVQMRRYADLRDRGQSLALSEFLDLIRLISRRPDARAIFSTAGRNLATEKFADSGALRKAARRLSTEAARQRRLLRSLSSAARALSPGIQIDADRDPPALSIEGFALAPAGIHGNACEILTAALGVCVTEMWDAELSVRHAECQGRGDSRCAWSLVESPELATQAAG